MSTASSSCRIDWSPSPLLCLALLALGLLAAASVLLSDLPAAGRALLALVAAGEGARLAWREWRRPPCVLEIDADGQACVQGLRLEAPRLRLRGTLASVDWRGEDGRRGALLWCTDTLPAPMRRQLLLRLGGQSPA